MKYVFDTIDCKRYAFPTHINDLVVDRADAVSSEAFVVIVEPGKATHVHKHNDVEQIFYIIKGKGILTVGDDKKEYQVKPAQVVKIPPGTLHSVRSRGKIPLKYLSIDCFCSPAKDESTWDDHVRTVCREQGYDYAAVVSTRAT
jgi:mannose-6-phosphate isomerase-like protein (cupin superfamily)